MFKLLILSQYENTECNIALFSYYILQYSSLYKLKEDLNSAPKKSCRSSEYGYIPGHNGLSLNSFL